VVPYPKGIALNKVSLKGVLIGSVTDIVATNLVMLPFIIYVTTTQNLGSVPKDQISSVVIGTIQGDPALFSIQLLLGSLCSMLGGYVAARIAKHHEVLNGALAAFLCVGSGLYGLFFSSISVPLWQHLIGFVVSPALSGLGGYLRLKTLRPQPDA